MTLKLLIMYYKFKYSDFLLCILLYLVFLNLYLIKTNYHINSELNYNKNKNYKALIILHSRKEKNTRIKELSYTKIKVKTNLKVVLSLKKTHLRKRRIILYKMKIEFVLMITTINITHLFETFCK